jgi:hypothetical protein
MNGSFAFRKAINLGEFHFLSKAHFQHGSKRIPSQGIQYDEGGEIYQELSIGKDEVQILKKRSELIFNWSSPH